MLEWLSGLNWWGGFGALCGIAIAAIVMHNAEKKRTATPHDKPVK